MFSSYSRFFFSILSYKQSFPDFVLLDFFLQNMFSIDYVLQTKLPRFFPTNKSSSIFPYKQSFLGRFFLQTKFSGFCPFRFCHTNKAFLIFFLQTKLSRFRSTNYAILISSYTALFFLTTHSDKLL